MSHWRPSLSELTAPFKRPRAWGLSLEQYGKGIDNAHVDLLLGAALSEALGAALDAVLRRELHALARGRRPAEPTPTPIELHAFRDVYLAAFEGVLERSQGEASPDLLALFQVAFLKAVLQGVAEGLRGLVEEVKAAASRQEAPEEATSQDPHADLALLAREGPAIHRRTLRVMFRELRRLEGERLDKLRASLAGADWPIPDEAFHNPVLMVPNLERIEALAPDYPVAQLGEGSDTRWLYQTNQCISKVFQYYLPSWAQLPSGGSEAPSAEGLAVAERLDQGSLRGFLETEILLGRFVPREEYREGRRSWLDEPQNLRVFLSGDRPVDSHGSSFLRGWGDPRWSAFRRAMVEELRLCLDLSGLTRAVTLLYWLASVRVPLARTLPFGPILDHLEGRLSRRRLAQRLESTRPGLDQAALNRLLDRAHAEVRRLPPAVIGGYQDRYLVDFLTLRRDLKLAYKAYEAMDRIRLLEDPAEVRLSRSNGSLIALDEGGESSDRARHIRSHVVIKADVRGSTRITEQLYAQGLNPASHFSLNFFEPVNGLLPQYGAEKVFVEGDAVILAIFEYEDEGTGSVVARACGLARAILQVVAVQNALNRKHGLPDLELGLGIAYVPQEPNFLFDEGHRIMISGAINQADRLSSCDARLRRVGFAPEHPAFRVTVVHDARAQTDEEGDDDLHAYNVDGVRIDEAAFFKLQKELGLRPERLPEEGLEDALFFAGRLRDLAGRDQWLVVRYGAVHAWDGERLGAVDERRRHFFEVIVDEGLTNRVRRLLRNGSR